MTPAASLTVKAARLMSAALLVLGGCGTRTSLPGATPGASGGIDAGDDANMGVCNPQPNPFPIPVCTPDAQKQCKRWAQSLAATGYGRATCSLGQRQAHCLMGDSSCFNDHITGLIACQCDDRACFGNEVCVSDTPAGPSSCRPICLAQCEPRPCTQPGEKCWCLGDQDVCGESEVCVHKEGISPLTCQARCPSN
jgi:hypothetical protein